MNRHRIHREEDQSKIKKFLQKGLKIEGTKKKFETLYRNKLKRKRILDCFINITHNQNKPVNTALPCIEEKKIL